MVVSLSAVGPTTWLLPLNVTVTTGVGFVVGQFGAAAAATPVSEVSKLYGGPASPLGLQDDCTVVPPVWVRIRVPPAGMLIGELFQETVLKVQVPIVTETLAVMANELVLSIRTAPAS